MNEYKLCKLHSLIIPSQNEKMTTWIFIHGLLSTGAYFVDLALTDEISLNSEIHLIDLRNRGRSPKTETMFANDIIMDIRHYIDDHQLKEVCILGAS